MKNWIHKVGIIIILLGTIVSIVCGNVWRVIDQRYAMNNLNYPSRYPLSEAPYNFNWSLFWIMILTFLVCGFFIYCLGVLVQNQEKTYYELRQQHDDLIKSLNELIYCINSKGNSAESISSAQTELNKLT